MKINKVSRALNKIWILTNKVVYSFISGNNVRHNANENKNREVIAYFETEEEEDNYMK